MIDSHCHLAGEEFEPDLPDVVDRARVAGLTAALVILSAGEPEEARRAERLASIWPGVRFAGGIHPHQAAVHHADVDAALAALDTLLTDRAAVALGEIGLDYHYDFAPRDVQQEIFRRQLDLARARDLPVIIHTREADDDTFSILQRHGAGLRTVFHCFTGTPQSARRVLDLGAWISFSGIVTFPRAEQLREVARTVPADRFLVETDAPYLAPVPHRGRRNEPSFVARVVEMVGEVRGEHSRSVAERTTATFERVFGARAPSHASLRDAPP